MEGRISVDALPIIKRDYKLDKYTLDAVCKKFIGKSKHDVSAPEMFLTYEDMKNTYGITVCDESIKKICNGEIEEHKGQRFKWI
jgi:DNA polymerase elongation subunit (family B)